MFLSPEGSSTSSIHSSDRDGNPSPHSRSRSVTQLFTFQSSAYTSLPGRRLPWRMLHGELLLELSLLIFDTTTNPSSNSFPQPSGLPFSVILLRPLLNLEFSGVLFSILLPLHPRHPPWPTSRPLEILTASSIWRLANLHLWLEMHSSDCHWTWPACPAGTTKSSSSPHPPSRSLSKTSHPNPFSCSPRATCIIGFACLSFPLDP